MSEQELREAYLKWCDAHLGAPAGLEFDEFILPLVEALSEGDQYTRRQAIVDLKKKLGVG